MKKTDYNTAADLVKRHYYGVLDEMAEKILRTQEDTAGVFEGAVSHDDGIDDIAQSYAQKLWAISACIEYLRCAGAPQRQQTSRVTKIECSTDDVARVLSDWFVKNVGVSIVNISFLGQTEKLTCVITYQPAC